MDWRSRRFTLEKIRAARSSRMVANFEYLLSDGAKLDRAFDEFADPSRRHLRQLTDEELAELISTEPNSKTGRLAESVLRNRDNWRSPAKWSLLISLISVAIAVTAFFRPVQ